jgi:cation diffusion facilitator family transporter
MNKKVKIARLSVLSNSVLIVMKVIAGIMSGSVSIISEAIHSTIDLIAAVIAFFSVRISDAPPDHDHPYGHGKYENVSGVIEAALIFVAAVFIIVESVKKLKVGAEIESIGIGSLVMIISAIINSFVSYRLYRVAKETGSLALEADALHLKTDVYTSLGVGAGLGLIWITDLHILDPIVAILVAFFIILEAWNLLKKAYAPLLDNSISDDEIQIIEETCRGFSLKVHNLRTRQAGNYKFADMHLEMAPGITLGEAHEICNLIEVAVQKKIPTLDLNIHVEPLDP